MGMTQIPPCTQKFMKLGGHLGERKIPRPSQSVQRSASGQWDLGARRMQSVPQSSLWRSVSQLMQTLQSLARSVETTQTSPRCVSSVAFPFNRRPKSGDNHESLLHSIGVQRGGL